MRRRKVANAASTGVYTDPALIKSAPLLILLVDSHAPSTVPTVYAQHRRAPETQGKEKRCASSIPPTGWLALLKVVAVAPDHTVFA